MVCFLENLVKLILDKKNANEIEHGMLDVCIITIIVGSLWFARPSLP